MVYRIKDVIIKMDLQDVWVFRDGKVCRYSYHYLDKIGATYTEKHGPFRILCAIFREEVAELFRIDNPIWDRSTPIQRGSDFNSYGYGPSDEEAWSYLYLD